MNWRFWFFGKAAGTGNPTREHAAAPKQPASHPTQIIATLSDEDRAMFKSQHEQVMTKLNEEKPPQMSPAESIAIRKARMQEVTKILLCFAVACCLVPYWMTTDTLTVEVIPFAAFIGTASMSGLAMIVSYLLRDAECITILQQNPEDAQEAEFSYKAIWRNLPCFIFVAFGCLVVHMIAIAFDITTKPIIQSTALTWLNGVIYLIMVIYSICEVVHIVQLFGKAYHANSKFNSLVCPIVRVIWGYAFLTLFLSSTIS
jgi:hypothetical protein